MRFVSRLSDRETDDLLSGRASAGPNSVELAAFIDATRALFVQAPHETTAAAHLAAIVEATRLGSTAGAETVIAERPPTRRSRRPLALQGRMAAVAFGLALLAAFSGAAYAGALPGSVQGKVADIAKNVGLSLPGKEHTMPRGDAGNTRDGVQRTTDEPAQSTDTGDHTRSESTRPNEGDSSGDGAHDDGDQADTHKGEGAAGNRGEGTAGSGDRRSGGDVRTGTTESQTEGKQETGPASTEDQPASNDATGDRTDQTNTEGEGRNGPEEHVAERGGEGG